MSPQLLAMVLAPLLGLFIISIGNGFLSSLTTLRLDAAGTSPLMVGLISSAYFFRPHARRAVRRQGDRAHRPYPRL